MSTSRKPWLCEGSPWKTEAAFWAWVRGVLRKGWSKHPIKLEYIKKFRKRIPNPVAKNAKRFPECWGMTCSICQKDTVQSMIEIDHIGDSHSFTGLHDVASYVAHLFLVDFTSLRPLCKPCHKIVNQSQRAGVSFEEAAIQKEVIAICKKPVKDIKQFCYDYGYTDVQLSNPEKRRAAVEEILRRVK
jgi:hypothetical protein